MLAEGVFSAPFFSKSAEEVSLACLKCDLLTTDLRLFGGGGVDCSVLIDLFFEAGADEEVGIGCT